MLHCVRVGKVFFDTHVRIICPVRDVIHVRKCTRPSPALPYCKRREAGRGPGNKASVFNGAMQFYAAQGGANRNVQRKTAPLLHTIGLSCLYTTASLHKVVRDYNLRHLLLIADSLVYKIAGEVDS